MKIVDCPFQPIDTRVIVQIEKTDDKSKGGIIKLPSLRESEQHQCDSGILAKKGINAFEDILNKDDKPQVGDEVFFVRHAGRLLENPDDDTSIFRIMNDGDIHCIKLKR